VHRHLGVLRAGGHVDRRRMPGARRHSVLYRDVERELLREQQRGREQ
jgi:hypothetical protein